ncbi:MAG: hypothetical protein PHQ88_09715 [Bacteroides sp.]|nr:hypothetical protein [Bacteroides sp.]
MSIFKKKNTAIKESDIKTGKNQTLIIPEYNKYLEFLNMVNGKRLNEMFTGNTSLIPENMRPDLLDYFEKAKKNGLVYITSGDESLAQSLSKKELVEVLKNMNLQISGNKIDLANRIESNGGLAKLQKTGKVSDWIKLTDFGKSEIKVYSLIFNKQYDDFQQNIYNLFLLNKVSFACDSITSFKNSYPFGKSDFFMSYSGRELTDLCKTIRTSNVLEILEVPQEYQNAILSIMCMYFSFGDFNFEKKIDEIYPEFKVLLVNSELITIKDLPFIEFKDMIRGYPTK